MIHNLVLYKIILKVHWYWSTGVKWNWCEKNRMKINWWLGLTTSTGHSILLHANDRLLGSVSTRLLQPDYSGWSRCLNWVSHSESLVKRLEHVCKALTTGSRYLRWYIFCNFKSETWISQRLTHSPSTPLMKYIISRVDNEAFAYLAATLGKSRWHVTEKYLSGQKSTTFLTQSLLVLRWSFQDREAISFTYNHRFWWSFFYRQPEDEGTMQYYPSWQGQWNEKSSRIWRSVNVQYFFGEAGTFKWCWLTKVNFHLEYTRSKTHDTQTDK